MLHKRSLLAAVCGALVASVSAAQARDGALQAACFAPQALRALDSETRVARGLHDFDKTPKSEHPLASFAPVPAPLRGAIRRVALPAGEKLVALTFDLCEQRGEIAGYDGALFDYLRREGVRATLFAGGKWMRAHAARTEQLMTDPQFELANHGEMHRNLRLLRDGDLAAEIVGPQAAYERARRKLSATQCAARVPGGIDALPERLTLMRFPFGACDPTSLRAVNDAGLLAIQWDVSAGDPDPQQSAQDIARTVLARVKPGSIVVAHGNGRGWNTAQALPLIVPKLKAQGYQFVTVSELLARGKPVIVDSCYDAKPGDTDRYDLLAGGKAPARRAILQPTLGLPWLSQSPAAPAATPRPKRAPAPVARPPDVEPVP